MKLETGGKKNLPIVPPPAVPMRAKKIADLVYQSRSHSFEKQDRVGDGAEAVPGDNVSQQIRGCGET
jgi:hypothetical protein